MSTTKMIQILFYLIHRSYLDMSMFHMRNFLVNHHDLRLLFCISTTYIQGVPKKSGIYCYYQLLQVVNPTFFGTPCSLSKIGSERLLIAGSFQDPIKMLCKYSYSCTKLNIDTLQFCADFRCMQQSSSYLIISSAFPHIFTESMIKIYS